MAVLKFLVASVQTVKDKLLTEQLFDVGHNIGSNRMRVAGLFVFDPAKHSRGGLPTRHHRMVKIICYPLMK